MENRINFFICRKFCISSFDIEKVILELISDKTTEFHMSAESVFEKKINSVKGILKKAQSSDEASRLDFIIQTHPLFRDLLKYMNEKSKHFNDLVSVISSYIKTITPNLKLFLQDEEKANLLCPTMMLFLKSPMDLHITNDLSFFVISFAFNDFSQLNGTKVFEPFLASFFSDPRFAVPFENAGGLVALWELLLNENKSYLAGVIFPEITKTIHLYFQSTNSEPAIAFLNYVNSSFSKVPSSNIFLAFQFLYDLIFNSKYNLLKDFINLGGFKTINQYILDQNDVQLIYFYQIFRPMCVDMNGYEKTHPILQELIGLLTAQNISIEIKFAGMTQLFQAIGQFPHDKSPILAENLYDLEASFENVSSNDLIILFIKICSVLAIDFNLDIGIVIKEFPKIISYQIAIDNDIEILFTMFKNMENRFTPYALNFFSEFSKELKSKEFSLLIKKYPIIMNLLQLCFSTPETNEHLLTLVLRFLPVVNLKKNTIMAFILKIGKNIEILINFLHKAKDSNIISALLKSMINVFAISPPHRNFFNSLHCLYKFEDVNAPPGLIFDLFVSLSGRHFIVSLDQDVYEFLKTVNYYEMPEEAIHKLAFGIYQNKPLNGTLIFPSILHKCGNFTITSPYDMWICGQYAVDKWIEETGKTIDEFPCISTIAQRYLLPKHVQNIFNFPKLFSECCKDTFGSIPLFEFPKDMQNTKIVIPVPNESRTVSFWFFVKEYPPSKQIICTFHNVIFAADGDELYVNNKIITDYPMNRWYHVVISTTDKMQATVYLDTKNVYSCHATASSTLHLGGESNFGYWFLGGCIRVFKVNLLQKAVENLFSRGVHSIIKSDNSNEVLNISPKTYIQLFGNPKANDSLSENSRPVISFSFMEHINHAHRGGNCPLSLIFKLLQEKKTDDCSYLLDALCSMQKNGMTGWAPNFFAVRMSAVFLLCPQLFESTTLTNILSCFTSDLNDTIMWDAILSFLLDFGLFNSSHRSFIISKMFEYVAQFSIDEKISNFLVDFVFHVLTLIKCEPADFDALLALIHKIKPHSNQVASLIASLPSFKEIFKDPTLVYKTDFGKENQLYQALLEYLMSNIDDKFHYYCIIYTLPPIDAFKLILSLFPKNKIPVDDRYQMLFYCLSKTEMKESWDAIISLLTNTRVNLAKDSVFDVRKVDPKFNMILIVFLSFAGIHALNNKDNTFWSKLWQKMLKIAHGIISNIQDLDRNFLFAIDQLLSFGKLSKYLSIFPYVPSISEPEKVADLALSEGQPFPDGPSTNTSHPTFNQDQSIVEETRQKFLRLIPEKKHMLPPHSNQFITTHRDKYTNEFVEEAIKQNNNTNFDHWVSLMPQRNFTLEELHKSKYMKEALRLATSILVSFIDKPSIFKSAFVHVMLSNALVNSKHSLFIMRSMIFDLYQVCSAQKVFDPFIANFISFAIGEGWFKGKIIETIHLLLSFLQRVSSPITRTLIMYMMLAFQLIHHDQIPDLLKLFITFKDVIFSKENLARDIFTIMLFDKMKALIDEFKPIITQIADIFQRRLTKMINPSDDKSEEQSIYKFLVIAIKKLCQGGVAAVNQLSFDEPELESIFTEKYNQIKTTFKDNVRDNVISNLKKNSERRITLTSLYFQQGFDITTSVNNSFIQNITISSLVRYHSREMLLFDEEFFLRLRERLLTPHQYFTVSLAKTKTLSLLSDPVLPTRRLEKSPMIYKIPQFPAVNIKDVSPDFPIVEDQLGIWPSSFFSQLQIDFQPYETLMMHSPNQLNLTFSYHFEINDWLLLEILQSIANNGEKFKLLQNVSLLYGLDPLPGVVLINDNFIFFVEGLRVSEKGVRFVSSKMSNILYSFYISYMVSGYFGQCFLFSGHPILKFPKLLITSCTPRFWLQEPVSIEVSFLFGWAFIMISETLESFKQLSSILNDTIEDNYSHFPPQTNCLSPINSGRLLRKSHKELAKEWCDNNIDNFTYLCILNKLAGRSFLDFSQYYVFPWIVSDFVNNKPIEQLDLRNLALPMGQIGPERLERFDAVFEESGHQYFYGTHYMHLNVVLFYLFRNDPFCLFSIYFHHGYDHPNRIFHDINEAWNSAALISPADVKESVPQMFCVPEFLTNTSLLPLTSTTDGRPVDNVKLPAWAKNSHDFIHKQRELLESIRVTPHISEWIDLIFGYKSRGEACIEAKNAYQPLCYVENKNSQKEYEDDEIDKEAAITCIINFGQCAKQLFKSPHVAKNSLSSSEVTHLMSDPSNIVSQKLNSNEFKWPISDIYVSGPKILFVKKSHKLLFGNTIIYSAQRGSILKVKPNMTYVPLFDVANSVDFFLISNDGAVMALFQKEGSINIYTLRYDSKGELLTGNLQMNLQTLSNVYSAAISTIHFLIIASCGSTVQRFDLGLQSEVEPIVPGFFASKVAIDDKGALIIIGGNQELGVWSISGTFLMKVAIDSPVSSLISSNLDEKMKNRYFVTGHQDGTVRFWTVDYSQNELILLKSEKIFESTVQNIGIDENGRRVVVASKDEIYSIDYFGSKMDRLKKEYGYECALCKEQINNQKVKVCSNCQRFYCSKCATITGSNIPSNLCRYCLRILNYIP